MPVSAGQVRHRCVCSPPLTRGRFLASTDSLQNVATNSVVGSFAAQEAINLIGGIETYTTPETCAFVYDAEEMLESVFSPFNEAAQAAETRPSRLIPSIDWLFSVLQKSHRC